MRLYLGNITMGSGPTELRTWLEEKGVTVLNLVWPRDNNGLKPFCFIDVDDDKADRIISELHGQEFNSRPLTVNHARPKPMLPRN